jgi:hypothetical protein
MFFKVVYGYFICIWLYSKYVFVFEYWKFFVCEVTVQVNDTKFFSFYDSILLV